ncbi:MAG: hypothetical protein E6I52_23540 [Chloroflexi bacterium]|nr:MAG: hypothetical protein E6I52_23540 [Chloroflexota bacterium]
MRRTLQSFVGAATMLVLAASAVSAQAVPTGTSAGTTGTTTTGTATTGTTTTGTTTTGANTGATTGATTSCPDLQLGRRERRRGQPRAGPRVLRGAACRCRPARCQPDVRSGCVGVGSRGR